MKDADEIFLPSTDTGPSDPGAGEGPDIPGRVPSPSSVGRPGRCLRVRSPLLAYHVALDQANADVAVMLFVSAIERSSPPEEGDTPVHRSVTALCPNVVNQLTAHLNAPQAFGDRLAGRPGRSGA